MESGKLSETSDGDLSPPEVKKVKVASQGKENEDAHNYGVRLGRRAAGLLKFKLLSDNQLEKCSDLPVTKHGRSKRSSMEERSYSPTAQEESEEEESKEEPVEEEGLCEYEKMRLRNIQENLAFMASLNLSSAKKELKTAVGVKKKTTSLQKKKPPVQLEPSRRSLRLRNIQPDGTSISPLVAAVSTEGGTRTEHAYRFPSDPIMMTCNENSTGTSSEEQFRHDLVKTMTDCQASSPPVSCRDIDSAVTRATVLSNLQLTSVERVNPRRITALKFLPSTHKVVVTGDLHGGVGLWDVDSGPAGVFNYHPHSRCVTELALPRNPASNPIMVTTSFDGTVRLGHFEKGVFEQLYSTPEEAGIGLTSCSLAKGSDWAVVSQSNGRIVVLDLRQAKKPVKEWQAHQKTIKCIDFHPVASSIVATSSNDCFVKIWDLRNVGDDAKELCSINSFRSVNSAYFSPITGKQLLVTSLSNSVRIHHLVWSDPDSFSCTVPGKYLYHNTQTGRWLTPLRAQWDPTSDECFTVGSMEIPRQVEIHTTGDFKTILKDPQLNSVCSLTCVHPHRTMVAGGNASGYVYLWGA